MPQVEIEVTANIAEYAAMHGLSYKEVHDFAKRNYIKILLCIHHQICSLHGEGGMI